LNPAAGACRNLLLNALPIEEFSTLEPLLERVPLEPGSVLVQQGDPIEFVWFPEGGVTAMADVYPDGRRVVIALIGREGMLNSELLLGCREASHYASVEVDSDVALRLAARDFRHFCASSPVGAAPFLSFVHVLATQTARTLAAKLHQSIESRLSRWLLMCHDRVDGDEIRIMHAQLGGMLGVRRATVTDALHRLEELGLLRSLRRRIQVRSRAGLEQLAGDLYGFPERQYTSSVTRFGKGGEVAPSWTRSAPREAEGSSERAGAAEQQTSTSEPVQPGG
jgi:CRP-like cAMP-binding protein